MAGRGRLGQHRGGLSRAIGPADCLIHWRIVSKRPPIVFFAFNRPDHTQRSLAALRLCTGASESELIVFVDGPRSTDEAAQCDQVALLAQSATGFASVSVVRSDTNRGLFRAITSGVDEAFERFDSIIVVEDDLVVTGDFLDYMAVYLQRYSDNPLVGCIHGYALPFGGLPDFYFLRGADCWGWATWRDRWKLFSPDPDALIAEMGRQGLFSEFMLTHGAGSLSMLCNRALGKNQSWAILWHASLFLAGRLTLHPGRSFVANIGNDGSGTHTSLTDRYSSSIRASNGPQSFPMVPVLHDPAAALLVSAFMDNQEGGSALDAVLIWFKRARAAFKARLVVRRLGNRLHSDMGFSK